MSVATKEILDLNRFDATRTDGFPPELAERVAKRQAAFGASSVLFYEQPIEMVRASGAYMYDAGGRKYLDVYNNVPSVGHCHPRVVEAVARQIGELNIHTRYLNRVVETYTEKLLSRFPRSLSNVVLTCTGSESNDLAMRIARIATGAEGFIVTEAAYHGNTALVTEISPSSLRKRKPAPFVAIIPAPAARDGMSVEASFAASVEQAIAELKSGGIGLAALIIDTIFSSDGIYADPAGFLKGATDVVHRAGGLLIADEVQPGFGRTGGGMWGFERHGVTPDIVTMGKPMGNGFPMGGVVTRPEFLKRFCEETGYFNTFGGNPVAAAAGHAVLQVIEDEGLVERSATVGGYFKRSLEALQGTHSEIGEVRGAGLFIGLDFIDPATGEPDTALATHAINQLKHNGILIGAAGKYGATLKIRPPLCFSQEDAELFTGTLDTILNAR
ncbi:MAG: aspartate aminotransferase family protein [Alphaproteobacteria bacterium]|nr:aspartate aminotransferase family protein [Rhizobiaceae bacterium]MBU3959282.1 aspartate aminotransferase family protein [Alphaproteobacteria bacterium]MBU4049220.1 aspartate aminotransferase family protein [Alphaproteobacteria bacterium]MBU4091833.1 aspartate aminotransferase family protein [Alphaproteobacteria bacterium]MBU4156778.1 aspartate aminotransferase family protein [Alphaproteobacteria bacterium]